MAEYFNVDTATGNFTVAGGFTGASADEFPAKLREDGHLILVIDGVGPEPDPGIRVSIRLDGVEEPLASNDIPLRPYSPEPAPGSPTTHNLRVALKDLVFPSPGVYFFDVYLGERLAHSLRFVAQLRPGAKS